MNMLNRFQTALEKFMGPIAAWFNQNKCLKSLSAGFMATMPVTLGSAVIAILANLQFESYVDFMTELGLLGVMQDFASLTLSLLAIPIVMAIAYFYTKELGEDGLIGAVITVAVFVVLMPIAKPEINGTAVNMLNMKYLGSEGIFPAILCGLVVPAIFCRLMKLNIKLKLPDSVPTMVSKSLSPLFVAMILFFFVFMVKYGFTLTSYGNMFDAFSEIITKPVLYFGASPWSLIAIYCFQNLCWWFGVHPAAITNAYFPVILNVLIANGTAYMNGQPLTDMTFIVLYVAAVYVGGNGNTLGLCIATLFAKSEKYKSLRKVVIPANLFNINEPIIFGFPVVLNPLYFIPMVFSSLLSGVVAMGLVNVLPLTLTPTFGVPWVMPVFISAFMYGGFWLLFILLISIFIHFVLYMPFFKIDDKKAYEEEQMLKQQESEL